MILIHHPSTGAVIDLAECIVLDTKEIPAAMAVDAAEKTADLAIRSSTADPARRVYLLAVAERDPRPDGGTNREAVVLNTLSTEHGSAAQTLLLGGDDLPFFDDVHDLFMDIF